MVEDLEESERNKAKIRARYGENIEGMSRDLEACQRENRQLKQELDELKRQKSR
jgi:hypothetical protein